MTFTEAANKQLGDTLQSLQSLQIDATGQTRPPHQLLAELVAVLHQHFTIGQALINIARPVDTTPLPEESK
jgi:hypothetical protein